ncbi:MAG: hypothetical protein IIX85_00200, partial [Clostridia bacterium]|nr:hypothetical protein [Clostridia bacterium]
FISKQRIHSSLESFNRLNNPFFSIFIEFLIESANEDGEKMQKLLDMLDDNDDVTDVWHNWDN